MFVGILNANAVLYLWDQLFLMEWNIHYLEIITKTILYFLRQHFLRANDYEQMRQVFLLKPSRLYTSDIQQAFLHCHLNQEHPQYIPTMNRQVSLKKSTLHDDYDRNVIGIKNISLELLIPLVDDQNWTEKEKI